MDSYKQRIYNPYIDDMTDYHKSDNEDEAVVKLKRAPTIVRPISVPVTAEDHRLHANPRGVKWTEEESQAFHEGWDDKDNNPNSYAYDDYGQEYVSFSNTKTTNSM